MICCVTVDDENELDRYAVGYVDNVAAQTEGDEQSVHCVEWQQTDAYGHQHNQAQVMRAFTLYLHIINSLNTKN